MRNGIVAFLFSLFLLGPLVFWFCGSAPALSQLPSWATNEDAKYLGGASMDESLWNYLSLDCFMAGTLQGVVETKVGEHIPCKSVALLGSAAMQRSAIELSNEIFGWEVVPSYFGSDVAIAARYERLLEIPQRQTRDIMERYVRFFVQYEGFADRHEGKNVFVYCAPTSGVVTGGPVAALMSSPVGYELISSTAEKALSHGSLIWINGDVSFDQFDEGWYRTDHHWNIAGACVAFWEISEAMGFDGDWVKNVELKAHERPVFYGTLARRALFLGFEDKISDLEFSLGGGVYALL